jgi:surface protein
MSYSDYSSDSEYSTERLNQQMEDAEDRRYMRELREQERQVREDRMNPNYMYETPMQKLSNEYRAKRSHTSCLRPPPFDLKYQLGELPPELRVMIFANLSFKEVVRFFTLNKDFLDLREDETFWQEMSELFDFHQIPYRKSPIAPLNGGSWRIHFTRSCLASEPLTDETFKTAFMETIKDGFVNGITYVDSENALVFGHPRYGPISDWNTHYVTNMSNSSFFTPISQQRNGAWHWGSEARREFNQPIGRWDVSNVTTMKRMLAEAPAFNQPIGDWDVSRVTDMREMFLEARTFNQPLNSWNVSNVTIMHKMFLNALAFNQPITNWKVANVTNMKGMFHSNHTRLQEIASWFVTRRPRRV